MMQEMTTHQTSSMIHAEEFLNGMAMDDEEKQEEPQLTLPKSDSYLPNKHVSLAHIHHHHHHHHHNSNSNTRSSFGHKNSYTSAPPLSRQTSSGWGATLWNKMNPFGVGINQSSINLMDTGYSSSFENTPVEVNTINISTTNGMACVFDDVYIDEASGRGTKRGGVNGPFNDNGSGKQNRRRSLLVMVLMVGLFFVAFGLAATAQLFLQKKEKEVVVPTEIGSNNNSTSWDDIPGVGTDDDVMEATLKEALDTEEQAISTIVEVGTEKDTTEDKKELDVLKEEESILEDLQHAISEEEEVVEEEDNAVSEKDKELLEEEQENLSHQQENLSQEASLIESEVRAETTPAEAKAKRDETQKLDLVEMKLEKEQQLILKKEAKEEGWDYDRVKDEVGDELKEEEEEKEEGEG